MGIRKNFSIQLQEAIKFSNLTYAELARKLNITKATMSMYKSGKALPSLETFEKMCDYLDVSADYLMGLSDNY